MRILLVSQMVPYLPCHDGFRLIPAHLIRCLSERHEVHLLARADGTEEAHQLNWPTTYCRSVEILPAHARKPGSRLLEMTRPLRGDVTQAVRARIAAVRPDNLHLEGPAMAPIGGVVASGVPTLLSSHDALSLRHREFARFARSHRSRVIHAVRALAARRFERRWYDKVDDVVVTSPADLEALRRSAPRARLATIPNGVDLDYWAYRPAPILGRIIFTGNMSWLPNEDAAEYFAVRVLPLVRRTIPEAHFWIVGAAPSPRVRALANIAGVHVSGTVQDLRTSVWTASVYASPLRFGAGVKNKILEAMALGTPIVATPESLTALSLVPRRHLLVAKDGREMSDAVTTLLLDDSLRQSLSKEARREVELRYSWESIAARFEKLYRT